MVLAVVSNSAMGANSDNLNKNDDVIQKIELAKQLVLAGAFLEDYAKNHPISDAKPDQRERLQLQSIEKVKAKLRAKAKIKTISSAKTAALVNGVPIPQARINLRVKIEIGEGKTDSPELRKAMQEKMIDLELVVQEAVKLGLNKTDDVIQKTELAEQTVLVDSFVQGYLKNHPISDAKPDQRERLQMQSIENAVNDLRAKAKIETLASTETAALVNGVPISQARINRRIRIAVAEGKAADSPELRKAILEDMINIEVMVQEAVKYGEANMSNSAKVGSTKNGKNNSVAAPTNTKEVPYKTKELITFKGIPLGQPGAKDALMKMCYEVEENKHRFRPSWDTHLSEDVCLFEEFPTQFIVKNYGNMVNKKANFSVSSNGTLLEIEFIKTYKESVLALAELLESKYGVPTRIRSTVENGMGTKFENITFVWEDDQGSRITIDSMYEKIDQGRVLIQSSGSVAARNTAGKKAIEIDKSNL